MQIDTGNVHDTDTNGTGWFIGFSGWTRDSVQGLRHVPQDAPVTGLCVKWFRHEAGHASEIKPVSAGRTMSILVTEGAHFELDFCERADFAADVRTIVFRREGDFAVWGEGLFHRWRCLTPVTIATVRWTPG